VDNVDQAYVSPDGAEAVIVSGSGDEEYFYPRTRVTGLGGFLPTEMRAHALDPMTQQVFVASKNLGTIAQINTSTGATTTLLSGIGLASQPQMMAIGYVNGLRHFLLALPTGLLDIDNNGNPADIDGALVGEPRQQPALLLRLRRRRDRQHGLLHSRQYGRDVDAAPLQL
jgi:hypothetical protein